MISRKIFIGRVSLPAITPTSLYSMMRDSSLHWGFEDTTLTTPSLDSITGSEAQVKPDAQVFVGSDSNVSPSTGIALAAGATLSLEDFGSMYGVIDPNAIWFYNQAGCQMNVVFQAR